MGLSNLRISAMTITVTAFVAAAAALTGLACGNNGASNVTVITSTTTGTTAQPIAPVLALSGSWFTDNLNHQEPIAVDGVAATQANTLFVVFIASDSGQGPERGGPPLDGSIQGVTGGGLTWSRQAAAHLSTTGEPGVAEIWTAFSPTPVEPFSVTVTRNNSNGANTYCDNWSGGSGPDICNGMVYVQAITGADPLDPIGATGVAGSGETSGKPGPLTVPLVTTRANSWVQGVGTDWSDPAPRVLPAGQTMLHEDESTPNQDSYWTQRIIDVVPVPGPVSLGITKPVDHDCNMAVVEILPALPAQD